MLSSKLGGVRAAQFVEPGRLEVTDVPEPLPGRDDVVLRVAGCGVCGSDLDSWKHGAYVSEGQILGHEFAGWLDHDVDRLGLPAGTPVTARPLGSCGVCRQCRRGDVQLCDQTLIAGVGYGLPGGFAEKVLVPSAVLGKNLFVLPRNLEPTSLAVVEPLAVAERAVARSLITPSDVVVVFGAGPIGLGVCALAALRGPGHLIVIEYSQKRREAALHVGATIAISPHEHDIVQAIREVTGPGGFGLGAAADVSIDCAGHPDAFSTAIKVTRHGGRLTLVGHSHQPYTCKPSRIIEKELTVTGSFAYGDEFNDVLRYVAEDRIDPEDFVSHRILLDNITNAFEVQADSEESLKVLVTP